MYLHNKLSKKVAAYIDSMYFVFGDVPRRIDGQLGIILLAKGNSSETLKLKNVIGEVFNEPKKKKYSITWQKRKLHIFYSGNDKFHVTYNNATLTLDVSDYHNLDYLLLLLLDQISPDIYILLNLWRNRKEVDNVLDVGANVGFLSFVAYTFGYRIEAAIEPVPDLYQLKCSQIKYLNIAVGDKEHEEEIVLSSTHRQGNTLSSEMLEIFPSVYGGNPKKINVNVKRIDEIIKDRVGLIKIDVEGFEANVILGCQELFRKKMVDSLLVESYDCYIDNVHKICSSYFEYSYVLSECNEKYRLIPLSDDILSLNFIKRVVPPTYFYSNFEIKF